MSSVWSPLVTVLAILILQVQAIKTRSRVTTFEIHLSNGAANPVGIGERPVILINDSFVGPTLHAKQGDDVKFLVRNYLEQGTSVHFHGISQSNSPWSDGVPGLTQASINPGASYLYQWQAQESGVYFYHAHARSQMMDGMYGAIIIEPAEEEPRPFHLMSEEQGEQVAMTGAETSMETLMISDWTQFTSTEFHAIQSAANVDMACIDAIIINGIGSQYCLDNDALDNMTHPVVRQMLHDLGVDHVTHKGCIPAMQEFQGDFDLDLDRLPPTAYDQCLGGQNDRGNFTLNVNSSLGWAALTFINPGSLYPLQVSIDGHEPTVFAVDGRYVMPIKTDRFLVNTGSRISIMIKLDQRPGRYTIRIANSYLNQILGGFGELAYDGSNTRAKWAEPKIDFAGHPLNKDVVSFIPEDTKPYPAVCPKQRADKTFKILLRKLGRPYGAYEWTMTGKHGYNMSRERTDPPLLLQNPNDISRDEELILKTNKDEWVDIIMVTEGPFAQAHPMHKHGNRMFLIGSGKGNFPWESVEEASKHLPEGKFNLETPPYLDTFNTVEIQGEPTDTWTAIRYKADSPGVWLFHCHVQTHLSGGMAMVLVDGVDDFPEVPLAYREWNGFEPPYVI
ncbi:multicopper oxidase [Zasmidium cellare ATCC 36951]|uniref:Multicopper oxidase n=1 Tax=Zasmidium cellare ATCC 36951 TaxID=1080233 RepID=A0A6A6CZT5_ZASCE|nr:multicopper oxidase [Zasmidium cellare ATCC 36951]KAF2172654.1 multicopper oxidase [Zasmidium cellare ATCC 36951]